MSPFWAWVGSVTLCRFHAEVMLFQLLGRGVNRLVASTSYLFEHTLLEPRDSCAMRSPKWPHERLHGESMQAAQMPTTFPTEGTAKVQPRCYPSQQHGRLQGRAAELSRHFK